jgi:hypothetical protein
VQPGQFSPVYLWESGRAFPRASRYFEIRALHRSYFRELRAIVAQSQPAQTVALVTMSLVELSTAATSA